MFSVVIPLYNKAPYICRAIDSVLAQSFPDYEIIVVNDGSIDGGDQLIEAKYSSQIRLIHQPNQGVSAARNTGIENSRFNYVSFLDADDFWHRDFLLSIQDVISRNPSAGVIGTKFNHTYVGHSMGTNSSTKESIPSNKFPVRVYNAEDYFNQAIKGTLVCASATTIKKEFFDNKPNFDPMLKFGEDLDIWFRAILYYEKLFFIPCVLAFYSQEDGSAATKKIHLLEHTLIPKIINKNYLEEEQIKNGDIVNAFKKFRIKWIYLRLYPLYRLKENSHQIKSLISKMPFQYFFLWVLYQIPFDILHRLLSRRFTNKVLVKYINLCFRYIYK